MFLTEMKSYDKDFRAIGILLYNCLFGENLVESDFTKVLNMVNFMRLLRNQEQKQNQSQLNEFVKKNPFIIVILKRLDVKILDFCFKLLTGEFLDITSVLKYHLFWESRTDGIFENDLSTFELIQTFHAQERQTLKNPKNVERIVSTKYSSQILKFTLQQILEKAFQMQQVLIYELKSEKFKNWVLLNERSIIVKEFAELLGLSRKKIFFLFRKGIVEYGLLHH